MPSSVSSFTHTKTHSNHSGTQTSRAIQTVKSPISVIQHISTDGRSRWFEDQKQMQSEFWECVGCLGEVQLGRGGSVEQIVENLLYHRATETEVIQNMRSSKSKKKPTPTKGHGMQTTLKHKHTWNVHSQMCLSVGKVHWGGGDFSYANDEFVFQLLNNKYTQKDILRKESIPLHFQMWFLGLAAHTCPVSRCSWGQNLWVSPCRPCQEHSLPLVYK